MSILRRFKLAHTAVAAFVLAFIVFSGAGFAAKVFANSVPSAEPVSTANLPAMTSEEIAARLAQANEKRAHDLAGFTGERVYNLDYQGFPGHREANIVVVARYSAPTTKTFDIVSESGSKWIQNRVLKRLLESEKDAANSANQRRTALNGDNYKFTLLGTKATPYGGCYRLRAEPLRDNKYLMRGEICVNANDFAVESIDAEPAKNPSFWIQKTHIEHRYVKIGEFWLPASNRSVTNVLLGGTATLTIDYKDYRLSPGVAN